MFNYQGVARDNSGNIIANQAIGIRFTVRSGFANGTVVYQETQTSNTNQFGLFTTAIGTGNPVNGSIAAIEWGSDNHFLQVELDIQGGSNYSDMGTSQLLSVPYALHAYHATSVDTLTFLTDLDYDTKIQVEETADEDVIRFDLAGVETWKMNAVRLEPSNAGQSLFIGNGTGFYDDLSDNQNTFVGDSSGHFNTSGFSNTAIGYNSLYANTSGWGNTALGKGSMFSNLTGDRNTAVGSATLSENTTGHSNAAVGFGALLFNTTGRYNTAIGNAAVQANTTGDSNVGVGHQALFKNSTGDFNTATGTWALTENTTGKQNTAIGHSSMKENTTGWSNTSVGWSAMYENVTGSNNTAFGHAALQSNLTGSQNTSIGYGSMFNNTDGKYNTAVGFQSLLENSEGQYRTGIGQSSNSVDSIFDNNTGIGFDADPTSSNSVHIGNTSVTSIKGQVGFTTYSDKRFKKNIREDEVVGLEFINRLKPVTYNYDVKSYSKWKEANYGEVDTAFWKGKYDIEEIRFSGFLAQDVELIAKETGYDFSGVDKPKNAKDSYGLRYAEFVVPLVKAVQELNEQFRVLQERVNSLEHENNLLRKKLSNSDN